MRTNEAHTHSVIATGHAFIHYLRMWQLSDNDIHVTGWLLNLVTQHSTSTHTIFTHIVATRIPSYTVHSLW